MEIIFLDFVDGELLFFATEFFPFALRFGYVLFGKLRNGVILVPEVEELLVDGFLFLYRFGIPHPFVIFHHADMQGFVLMRDDFYHSCGGQVMNQAESPGDAPVENPAPVAVAVHAFAPRAQEILVLVSGILRLRIVDLHKHNQERLCIPFATMPVVNLLLQQRFGDDEEPVCRRGLEIKFFHKLSVFFISGKDMSVFMRMQ